MVPTYSTNILQTEESDESANHQVDRTIRDIRLSSRGVHDNKTERMNGEVRDREKPIQGLKRTDSPIIKRASRFPMTSFDRIKGRTRTRLLTALESESEGKTSWITIIQNAIRPKA